MCFPQQVSGPSSCCNSVLFSGFAPSQQLIVYVQVPQLHQLSTMLLVSKTLVQVLDI